MVGPNFAYRLLYYLIGGIMFGLFFSAFSRLTHGGYLLGFLQDTAIIGASFSFLFGIGMEIFKKARAKKFKQVKLEIAQTSTILFDSAAALETKTVEGWLFITDENLIFRPRKINLQKPELIIPINSIQSIEKFMFSGFKIVANNSLYKILADHRNKWFNLLNTKLAAKTL